MEYRRLGRSDIDVSVICLGTMTWGEQNSETDAHAQLDLALDRGVNFIDTAEMYSVPTRAETYGRTEDYIGSWLANGGKRDKVVIATKVTGPAGDRFPYVRDGNPRLDRANIEAAVDASLARLRTDYIDLYQLHWPDREVDPFGPLGYEHSERSSVPLEETLGVLADLVAAGKIRDVGVSNETPWGVMRFVQLANGSGHPRMASIQNRYSLLSRSFEVGLAEVAIRENCGLLAYSPLGFGVLSGKYLDGAKPAGARLTLYPTFDRYSPDRVVKATSAYVSLARDHGLDPAQMALAFVNSRRFVTSNIIGATTLVQLETNIASADLKLGDEVFNGIEAIYRKDMNPLG